MTKTTVWRPVAQGWHDSIDDYQSLYIQDNLMTFHDSETGYERTLLWQPHIRLCEQVEVDAPAVSADVAQTIRLARIDAALAWRWETTLDTIRAALLTCKHYLPGAEPVRNHDVDAALAYLDSLAAPVDTIRAALEIARRSIAGSMAFLNRASSASGGMSEPMAQDYELLIKQADTIADALAALDSLATPSHYRDFRGILPHDPDAPTSVERLRRLREEREQDAPQD